MNRLCRSIVFFVLCVCHLTLLAQPFDGWTHLELGAANYGQPGNAVHPRQGPRTEACYLLDEQYFFYNAKEPCYDPDRQYQVLFWTLDQLIDRYGQKGLFHVNDLHQDYALYACYRLQEYAQEQGYDEVIIEAVISDFAKIDPVTTLGKYQRKRYDHVHLKNPEPSLFFEQTGGRGEPTPEHRAATRALLQRMADLSEEGLYLFTLYNDRFIPKREQIEFIQPGIFYQETFLWEPVPYVYPTGREVQAEHNRVFFIEPTSR